MRRSLLLRLLAVSVLVAVCAIAATAWLAVRTTTGAIQQEQGLALATDNRIYTTLLDYAATHPGWAQAGPTVHALAEETGRRIALRTENRAPITDSDPGSPVPATASAVLDPLAVDPSLVPDTPADRIAASAVGPFRLSSADRTRLDAMAQRVLRCVRARTGSGNVTPLPNGHPRVQSSSPLVVTGCGGDQLDQPTPGEVAALAQLTTAVDQCVGAGVHIDLSLNWTMPPSQQATPAPTDDKVRSCIGTARRRQLAPYVAPAALLFITGPSGATPTPFDLSADNEVRIALVAAAVLVLTIVVTVLAGARLIRPLRALTGAAQRMADGDDTARVSVRGNDEIARLAAAFNAMSAARERTEELRRAMVSDIAHELRTPLSNIRGWLEASQDGVTERDPALIDSLHEEALQLQHIVDDLQDLALADAGALRVHPEPVRLADVLRPTPGVRYRLNGVALTADPVRLRQMVDNLVANALRHTGQDGTVTVTGRAEGDQVVIDVVDTGSGITAADLPHVFDRFWRAEKSRTRTAGGSGLGLAIVRQLAEAHGGTVTATSTLGAGSTFSIRLPGNSVL